MKRCIRCAEEKQFREFNRNSAAKDGLHHYCRACNSAANAAWHRTNKKKKRAIDRMARQRIYRRVADILGGLCEICGSTKSLERDHRYGDGKWDRALMYDGRSNPGHLNILRRDLRVLTETEFRDKWRLLCSSCHIQHGARRIHYGNPRRRR